ncbi:MAG TPA: amino acid racemase [Candidatus Blautia intestinipullorum]|nr:amino acid racemase [Candidatus Blautia intestinipullorum]
MKKIGLVGGIGPASTIEYYLGIIQKSLNEQNNSVYPEIVIDSVNMLKHDVALENGDYSVLGEYLLSSLTNLKAAGAEIAAITANTEHIVWDRICNNFPLPVISIVEETIKELKRLRFKKALIFGTESTLRSGLYEKALTANGIKAVIPSNAEISLLGKLIYPNLENGIVIPSDKEKMIALANKYIEKENVDALILGCTELPLAIKPEDVNVPIVNTLQVHINAIYKYAIR